MSIVLSESGDYILDESGGFVLSESGIILQPGSPSFRRWGMIPFPWLMYRDVIQIQKARWEEIQGTPTAKYDTEISEEIIASVQSKSVERTDPEGRTTIVTVHTVRTPNNPELSSQDHIIWTDKNGFTRTLTAEGDSTPKGIGDVQYLTETTETV